MCDMSFFSCPGGTALVIPLGVANAALTGEKSMTILTHSNISIRLPKTHAELIVKAAIAARAELSQWDASRALAEA